MTWNHLCYRLRKKEKKEKKERKQKEKEEKEKQEKEKEEKEKAKDAAYVWFTDKSGLKVTNACWQGWF